MNEKWPVLDVFIGRDGNGWRMRFAPASWRPGMLHRWMNGGLEIFPVARPDADDLQNFMWQADHADRAHWKPDGPHSSRSRLLKPADCLCSTVRACGSLGPCSCFATDNVTRNDPNSNLGGKDIVGVVQYARVYAQVSAGQNGQAISSNTMNIQCELP